MHAQTYVPSHICACAYPVRHPYANTHQTSTAKRRHGCEHQFRTRLCWLAASTKTYVISASYASLNAAQPRVFFDPRIYDYVRSLFAQKQVEASPTRRFRSSRPSLTLTSSTKIPLRTPILFLPHKLVLLLIFPFTNSP